MKKTSHEAAFMAASFIRNKSTVAISDEPIGIILGTGWGDALDMTILEKMPFQEIPGFETLGLLKGHARELLIGHFASRQVIVLRGRVHINEAPANQTIYKMVRLQTEMLLQLGVRNLIVTNAAGSLPAKDSQSFPLQVGQIAVINGFVTLFAPDMPLWAGEFCSPEDAISRSLKEIALSYYNKKLKCEAAGYAMVRGPYFEGRRYDKAMLALSGAGVVGMSTLPEACIASLYNAKFLGLSFVTNSYSEIHSDENNQARVQAASGQLGDYLEYIVSHM